MDKWARILGVVVLTSIAWIGFYWWMSPDSKAPISFDSAGPATAAAKAPPPQPQAKPVLADLPKGKPQVKPAPTPDTHPVSEPPVVREPEPTPVQPPVQTRPTPPAVVPPRFNEYTVRAGDTLASIATMELGNSKFVDAIRRANPLKDMDKLKVGDRIRIPQDPTNIQGKPSPDSPPPRPPAVKQEAMPEYTVKAGDTLSKISVSQYGSAGYVEVILLANRDRLPKGATSLKPGQKLRIPPKQK